MTALHAISTHGWFGTGTDDRFTLVALGGWFGEGSGATWQGLIPLRTHLRQRLVTDPAFAALLATPGAVYHRHPPAPLPTPCAVYELLPLTPHTSGSPGTFRLTLRLLAHHPATLDVMRDAVTRLFEGHRAGTADWRIHHMTLESVAPVDATRTARVMRYEQDLRYHITATAISESSDGRIHLVYEATTLPLPRPAEITVEDTRLQAAGESTGGTFYLYDTGAAQAVHALSLTRLAGEDAATLRNFFALVQGMRHPFTYTDPDGVDRSVRFAGRTLALVQRPGGTWETTLRLAIL